MARLKPVKAEVTILVTLHHWKANRNLCNTTVQDFFFFLSSDGYKKCQENKYKSHWTSKLRKQWSVNHPSQHSPNNSRFQASGSQQYYRVRREEDLIPSSLPIPTCSHFLLPHSNFSTQKSTESNGQGNGKFSTPAQESVTFQPVG